MLAISPQAHLRHKEHKARKDAEARAALRELEAIEEDKREAEEAERKGGVSTVAGRPLFGGFHGARGLQTSRASGLA